MWYNIVPDDRVSVNQGSSDAQYALGYAYDYGLGVQENKVLAVSWYYKAATQEHFIAQHSLGDAYYYGYGVPKNLELAIKWYQQSANNGYTAAKIILNHIKSTT